MKLSEVVRTSHRIIGFLRRPLLLKMKLNTGQTLGTMNKREGGKIWLSLRGPIITLMGRPAARLEAMVLVFSSYVLVCFVDKRR